MKGKCKEDGPGSSQLCQAKGQEATGRKTDGLEGPSEY